MSRYQAMTDPAHTLGTKPQKALARGVRNLHENLRDSDIAYLQALVDCDGNRSMAFERAGLNPGSGDAMRSMHYQILRRIDETGDVQGVLTAIGMGLSHWAMRLAWLYAREDSKYTAVALKIHGIALGVFTPQQGSAGAAINVNVLQANQSAPDNPTHGLVQVTIDARKPLPPSTSPTE